ncbi:MAG: ABC transporter ATP-binding protein [Parvularculaceae bacterium]
MTTALSARGIEMDFGSNGMRTRVLHGVDLDIEFGKLTMLVGPSGCGKTTLLSIVSGTLRPTRGDVDVMNARITAMRDGEKVKFRRSRIGFIFQQYNLLPALTAAENAGAPLVTAGMSLDKATALAKVTLSGLGMGPHADKLPRQLSGGQQQRVAIARALIHNPAVIVCDEPTAALDADSGRQVMDLLKEASRDPSRAVLVVTHDNRIFHYADRIVSMEDGRIIRDVTQQTSESVPYAH